MATSSTTPSSTSTSSKPSKPAASTKLQKTGLIVEFSGAASTLTGAALSVGAHHYAIAALVIGGIVAILVGHKLHKE